MPVRNVVSWTTIIIGFAQERQIDVCLGLFHSMRNSNLRPNPATGLLVKVGVSIVKQFNWVLIPTFIFLMLLSHCVARYAQHGLALQSIGPFKEMKKQNVKANAITFLSVLSTCRHVGHVEEGYWKRLEISLQGCLFLQMLLSKAHCLRPVAFIIAYSLASRLQRASYYWNQHVLLPTCNLQTSMLVWDARIMRLALETDET
ncbi:Pentatricopeptide repeat [Parasponia andersonii]|uniref:Pentatricopeptide repeat n=1 Tax=Parasponia andersonii TaxID=3476 RepID=A0A2P5D1E0_PARAD|nr:Pentatricopeptide repeat [Parasponia andersonii]